MACKIFGIGLSFKCRACGVDLRRSNNAITFLIFALTHVLAIGMSGDLNSSPLYRRAPVKRMKYSISRLYRDTETWFVLQRCSRIGKTHECAMEIYFSCLYDYMAPTLIRYSILLLNEYVFCSLGHGT